MGTRRTTRRGFVGGLAATPLVLAGCRNKRPPEATRTIPRVVTRDLGPMGTGSNMFRSALVHSSGAVFIGTYGPQPGIIWKYDPAKGGELTKVAAPGEYQLDSMVEAPNGRIYIGTAYGGIVYELDPATNEVNSLGPPPVTTEATWIFTMTRTRDGEIYGARGVGLFKLDWRTGQMENLGVVPGVHETPGVSSNPIIRNLHERPDGLIWGDTNRWIFTFDRASKTITPVADVAAYDEACYGILHGSDPSPFDDLYFAIYPRFNDRTPRHTFMVCRAATGKLEPLELAGFTGTCFPQGWWRGEDGKGEPRWLISEIDTVRQKSSIAVVDVLRRRVDERWSVEGHETQPTRALDIGGPGAWFFTGTRGALWHADAKAKSLVRVATNPVPVECRCLAAAPDGRLGTDTYDCGFVFTFDPDTRRLGDHGRPYFDDHRANYGPAAFAGDGEALTFVANHGENEKTVRLYATEVGANRHRRIGNPTIQLVRMNDGSVCGTSGPNPPALAFDAKTCWTPAWAARGGPAFRYIAGQNDVQPLDWGEVGPIAPLPGTKSGAVVADNNRLRVLDVSGGAATQQVEIEDRVVALAADGRRNVVWVATADRRLQRFNAHEGKLIRTASMGFGGVERGFFVLPASGRIVGIAADGQVSFRDADGNRWTSLDSAPPPPAGPAVHPTRDAWYFAHRSLTEYTLG